MVFISITSGLFAPPIIRKAHCLLFILVRHTHAHTCYIEADRWHSLCRCTPFGESESLCVRAVDTRTWCTQNELLFATNWRIGHTKTVGLGWLISTFIAVLSYQRTWLLLLLLLLRRPPRALQGSHSEHQHLLGIGREVKDYRRYVAGGYRGSGISAASVSCTVGTKGRLPDLTSGRTL